MLQEMRRVRRAEVALTDLNDAVAAPDSLDSALAAQGHGPDVRETERDAARHDPPDLLPGDTIEEVAARLGIPAGTVKPRAPYGVQALRAAVSS
jgi:hypothetical protein